MKIFKGMRQASFSEGETKINYVIGGRGPPVLLLHGFPQNLAMWALIAPHLTEHFTVIASDLRGYGDSAKPKCLPDCSNYSFRAMAQDQLALMKHLGFENFHVVGHDRGGRTGHRLALDAPFSTLSLTVMDIVPTYSMFIDTNYQIAKAYWHWYFLAQPEPFPEHIIGLDPDYFYEYCLVGWGKVPLEEFQKDQLDFYRQAWRNPQFIHGSCSDYRATFAVDFKLDAEDLDKKIKCPTLVFWGTNGLMHHLFDMKSVWEKRFSSPKFATLPGGHFFPDQFPKETAHILCSFLLDAEKYR